MRPWIPAVLLLACADPADLPGDALAVPQLLLDAPATMIAGETIAVIASGTIAEGEEILVYASAQGPGAGPCYAWAGGLCLGLRSPAPLGAALVDVDGVATLEITVPATLRSGTRVMFQALVVRGRSGARSMLSNLPLSTVVDARPGCTDPNAANYDPTATVDDGTCHGCVGSEGDYAPSASETLSGAHLFDSVVIPAGVTVTGGAQAIDLTVCGPVQIDGVIDVSGRPGVAGTATANNPSGASGGAGGAGVAGGMAGGRGGNSPNAPGARGLGTGSGGGGSALANGIYYDGGNAGGAGFGTPGNRGFQAAFTGTAGLGGVGWGDAALAAFPTVGGSGGGGGSGGLGGASTGFGGGGGGAGGGVVRIQADGPITIGQAGAIRANGGAGASCQDTGARGGGGAGSGGAIWLAGPELINDGVVSATGGTNCYLNGGSALDGRGGDGRIRVDLPTGASPSGTFTPTVGYLGEWVP